VGRSKKNSYSLWLFLLLAIAFILRLTWVMKVHTMPVYDFYKYHLGALSMAEGHGYQLFGKPTAFEPIGYPMFLAILYKLIAPRIIVPKLFNIIMSLGMIILIYLIAKKLWNKEVGIFSALLLALSPRNIVYNSVLSTEIFFTFLLLSIFYLYLYHPKKTWALVLSGVIVGILTLTKPFMLLFPAVLFCLYWLESQGFIKAIKKTAIVALFMVLTIAPWTIRNYVVFGEFIPISTNGGITLYLNNNPYANGHWQDPFKFPNSPLKPYQDEKTGFWDELAVDKVGKKLAKEWIISHPADFFKLGFKKVYYVFNDAWDVEYAVQKLTNGKPLPDRWWVLNTARGAYYSLVEIVALYILLLPFILLQMQQYLKKGKGDMALRLVSPHLTLLLPIAFFTSINFIFEGQPRYIFPLLPFFIILGIWGLSQLLQIIMNMVKRLRQPKVS
jgi:4-amino-4-deoxy-L-arabinose transferase-like glycosyltransferase